MSNQVDTSEETVNREWARIVAEHKVGSPESEPEPLPPVDGSGLNFDGVEGVEVVSSQTPSVPEPDNKPTLDEKIAQAEMVINGALVFVFDALGGLEIAKDKYKSVAHAWAVVIAKRFEGGIFEFMAKYKDELSAVGATFVFMGAVRESVREKRASKRGETEKGSGEDSDSGEVIDNAKH